MDDILQHRLVQAQISDQLLQPGVLGFELLEPPQLAYAQTAILLLPVVKRGLRDAELAADLLDPGARLGLAQRKGNLLFGVLRSFHADIQPVIYFEALKIEEDNGKDRVADAQARIIGYGTMDAKQMRGGLASNDDIVKDAYFTKETFIPLTDD